jgi:ParB/RepB/Spo0J family partition protein
MSPEFKELELDSLYISPLNVRRDPGDLAELIDSIRDMGVLEPILVRQKGEMYEVIAGRRRLEAARRIGLQTIPASVLEVTDLQAIIISLIENVQRKDLTLVERVQTYHVLQQLAPEYNNLDTLAEALSLSNKKTSHQKISQDFQIYAVLRKLQPHGFTLASHLPPSALERQEGKALPEYHAVLIHQAMSALVEKGSVTEADADEKMVELATLIVPLSQDMAKRVIEAVKAGEPPDRLARQYARSRHFKTGRHGSSRRSKSVAKPGEVGGYITCSCCNRIPSWTRRSPGTQCSQSQRFLTSQVRQRSIPLRPWLHLSLPLPSQLKRRMRLWHWRPWKRPRPY